MNKITLRAITAFSRTDLKTSEGSLSIRGREINYLGKQYVALESESSSELLALYRCMNRGELKRLKRWPADLTDKNQWLKASALSRLTRKHLPFWSCRLSSQRPPFKRLKSQRVEQRLSMSIKRTYLNHKKTAPCQ